jgi:hypothetical protein
MVAMSGSSGFGPGDAAGAAGGAVIGTILGNAMLRRRQRRLAREAVRYLGPGEKLAAPIPYCHQGARRVQTVGLAIFALALLAGLICSAITSNGGLIGAVFFGGMGAGVLLMMVSAALATNYAMVLTDRRLLLFRTKGQLRLRLREIQIGVPRGQVSMSTQMRFDGAAVNLTFAPATGIPPVSLDRASPGACVKAVQAALTARIAPAAGPHVPGTASTGHRARGAA